MRKITLGIFSVLTIILFYFSTVPTATAPTSDFQPIDLYSSVGLPSPYAFVEIDELIPEQNWEIDINPNDNVKIICDYYWDWGPIHGMYPYPTLSGVHEFWFRAEYPKDNIIDAEHDKKETYRTEDAGSDTFEITVPACTEDSHIYVYWKVYSKHVETGYDIDDWEDGTIYLY